MLSAKQLTLLQGDIIFQQRLDNQTLRVLENSQYRWFTLGGNAIQAIMSKAQPHACLLAVPQALLIFLLWRNNANSILNLGLGSAGLERTLNHYSAFNITAIEQQFDIIEMAKHYFNLPSNVMAITASAESYLAKTNNTFDIVLCDIYQQEKSPEALFSKSFYQNISKTLKPAGCALMSINISCQQQLTTLLAMLHTLNLNLALIDFSDYKHIVVIMSKAPLLNKTQLIALNQHKSAQLNIDFSLYIERMHFIPALALLSTEKKS